MKKAFKEPDTRADPHTNVGKRDEMVFDFEGSSWTVKPDLFGKGSRVWKALTSRVSSLETFWKASKLQCKSTQISLHELKSFLPLLSSGFGTLRLTAKVDPVCLYIPSPQPRGLLSLEVL